MKSCSSQRGDPYRSSGIAVFHRCCCYRCRRYWQEELPLSPLLLLVEFRDCPPRRRKRRKSCPVRSTTRHECCCCSFLPFVKIGIAELLLFLRSLLLLHCCFVRLLLLGLGHDRLPCQLLLLLLLLFVHRRRLLVPQLILLLLQRRDEVFPAASRSRGVGSKRRWDRGFRWLECSQGDAGIWCREWEAPTLARRPRRRQWFTLGKWWEWKSVAKMFK